MIRIGDVARRVKRLEMETTMMTAGKNKEERGNEVEFARRGGYRRAVCAYEIDPSSGVSVLLTINRSAGEKWQGLARTGNLARLGLGFL